MSFRVVVDRDFDTKKNSVSWMYIYTCIYVYIFVVIFWTTKNNFIMKILVVFTLVNKEQRMDVKV
jgi:hypothetical protein